MSTILQNKVQLFCVCNSQVTHKGHIKFANKLSCEKSALKMLVVLAESLFCKVITNEYSFFFCFTFASDKNLLHRVSCLTSSNFKNFFFEGVKVFFSRG